MFKLVVNDEPCPPISPQQIYLLYFDYTSIKSNNVIFFYVIYFFVYLNKQNKQ